MQQKPLKQLADMDLLRRAWHLARSDSPHDFIEDPLRYADFAADLENNLKRIARRLRRSHRWKPAPLQRIDVPKSNLAVRPGAQMTIEDRIVMNALLSVLQPDLAKHTPVGVYSCRTKSRRYVVGPSRMHEILQFPFLKGRTVRRYLIETEPWYVAWPGFVAEAKKLATSGYSHMVITDIAAYFENIDLSLLRAAMRARVPRSKHGLVDAMYDILVKWEWPAAYGTRPRRGIPQGEETSRFLGNAYLLYLDEAFAAHELVTSGQVAYLRYMDDVKLLARNHRAAILALQFMNNTLRDLRLNIQGSKTRLLRNQDEILLELTDERLERVNALISALQARRERPLSRVERKTCLDLLKSELSAIDDWVTPRRARRLKGSQPTIRDNRDLRLYRRILTALILLQDPSETDFLLHQIYHNPDARLLGSAMRYFQNVTGKADRVVERLLTWLSSKETEDLLFDYTKAQFLRLLRHLPDLPTQAFTLARKILRTGTEHPYVRQQAAQLLAIRPVSSSDRRRWRQLLKSETDTGLSRALLGLCRPPRRREEDKGHAGRQGTRN
jgi:hypothetical protein